MTADDALAARHSPVLMLDAHEPYPPGVMGYTLFREAGQSPSSKFFVTPRGTVTLEYAIWYDWDIQHLYDLEHVWVHLGDDGAVIGIEASRHGKRLDMPGCDVAAGHPVLFAEPGKHAHWPDAASLQQAAPAIIRMCGPDAGHEGVHLGNRFAQQGLYKATPQDHRLARLAMKRRAFLPAFTFQPAPSAPLWPWADLAAWIPQRMTALMAALPNTVPHLRAVLLDCGDTLVDEASEVKLPGSEVVISGQFIPHAEAAVATLARQGYRLALVADGPRATFENLLKPVGLWSLFAAHVISEDVGELKPSRKMFHTALMQLGLEGQHAGRVVMVGNNLSRDIKGANACGMISIFIGWSHRRTHQPADASEQPDHSLTSPGELPALLERIELALTDIAP